MENRKILDCTLRDGGYINDWNFGYEVIKDIIQNLVMAETDYIEIGFLRNCEYDRNKTLYNNVSEANNVLPDEKGKSQFVLMALHNKYDINKLEEYDGGPITTIRVTFHDYDIDEGLEYCKQIMKKGYKCFCNPINIMGYSDDKIIKLIHKVNKIKLYGFSIVDTFGSMMKKDLIRIYSILENNLDKNIIIGLHLHDNMSQAYSLSQDFTELCNRSCVIDGSLLGMGRVPGNLCIELFMNYLNKKYGYQYNVENAFDIIDEYIRPIKNKNPWGYTVEYALSAKYNLHRNYAEFLINKEKLRTRDISNILSQIITKKKTAFDENYIEELYEKYLDVKIDDFAAIECLKQKTNNRKILILAPGASLNNQYGKVCKYISDNNPFIISTNFDDQRFPINCKFFSNLRRYGKLFPNEKTVREDVWVTSNITKINKQATNVINYWNLAFDGEKINDNSVIMVLKLLYKMGIKQVTIAGMDGYTSKADYINNFYENRINTPEKIVEINDTLMKSLKKLGEVMKIKFLTESIYKREVELLWKKQ